jgi:hypothetical protein
MNGVWTSTEDMTIVWNTSRIFSWSRIYCFLLPELVVEFTQSGRCWCWFSEKIKEIRGPCDKATIADNVIIMWEMLPEWEPIYLVLM